MTNKEKRRSDPVESVIQDALDAAGIAYTRDTDARACGLDFYLPALDTHIECKRLHAPRIIEQMSRVENIIVIQGMGAAEAFAEMLRSKVNDQ